MNRVTDNSLKANRLTFIGFCPLIHRTTGILSGTILYDSFDILRVGGGGGEQKINENILFLVLQEK